jgi:hypothetical protein
MRLRSKARKRFKSKGGTDNLRWNNRRLRELGLVSLWQFARVQREN